MKSTTNNAHSAPAARRHFNPNWQSDDALLANFIARQGDFSFLRDELAGAKLTGSVQHYLLVGVRGAGKTTLLQRLAVAIRRDADLADHLIALSFPEELYQIKNLADFWWATCDALADELDFSGHIDQAESLISAIVAAKAGVDKADTLSDAGFKLLQQTCARLGRRPVLLVDNLDMVFERIGKAARKAKDPHAPAYWALREALSTTTSPIVIGGSVRLSEPFTDYDKAFYDFFLPKRLGKLTLAQVREVLEHLADAQGVPEIKQRLQERPSRIEALFELTGGNLRALSLIFELLRQGPNGRAIEDFEHLMDITTPYYKGRFEDLPEQAQVIMHALAVRRPGEGDSKASTLRFGHTAAEIGTHAGLPTTTVSAQLDTLEREGLVEKSAAHGRTQYRIAEQLFRLWLQMRSTRRIRQNVIGLTEFLEAMFDADELQAQMEQRSTASPLSEAKLAYAMAGAPSAAHLLLACESQGIDYMFHHIKSHGGDMEDYLPAVDLTDDMADIVALRTQLQKCDGGGLSNAEQEAFLGSIALRMAQKQASVQALCEPGTAQQEAARLRQQLASERQRLMRDGLHADDLPLLWSKRTRGFLPLPWLTPQNVKDADHPAKNRPAFHAMVWRLLGAWDIVKFESDATASDWLDWGLTNKSDASCTEWANVAGAMRRSGRLTLAKNVLDHARSLGTSCRTWYERAALARENGDLITSETLFHKAINLDPTDEMPWNGLGNLLADKLKRIDEAEIAYRKAIELNPAFTWAWGNLGMLLANTQRNHEAESAYRKAIELDPAFPSAWENLGILLSNTQRGHEAEIAYRKVIGLEPTSPWVWNNLGVLLSNMKRNDEAEIAYRKAIELDPVNIWTRINLADLLESLDRLDEAAATYANSEGLDADASAGMQIRVEKLQTKIQIQHCTKTARQTLDVGNQFAMREALARLLAVSPDIAATLVNSEFVEQFLAPVLADASKAATVLNAMRSLGYEKHARPLLLAFEARLQQHPDMLSELEPEIQSAAQRMFWRLSAQKQK